MKRVALFVLFLVAATSASSVFAIDPLVKQGTWSPKDYRSPNPTNQVENLQALPSVSTANGVLFMSFLTDLSELKISVATAKGSVIYETLVSGNSGLTLPVRLGLQAGSYLLFLSHPKLGSIADKISIN
jgi:hypothetical protein